MGRIGTEDVVAGRLTGPRQGRYGRMSGGLGRVPDRAENAKSF